MQDFDDPFVQRLQRLIGFARVLYLQSKATLGWCDFGPEDLLSETCLRVLKLTEPRAKDGVRVIRKSGRPVDDGFLISVMKNVRLEMVRKSRFNRQPEPSEGGDNGPENPMETLEDRAPLQDKKLELEEERRLILERCIKDYNDPYFTEIIQKVLYEGHSFSDSLTETMEGLGVGKGRRSTYYRRFSKMLSKRTSH